MENNGYRVLLDSNIRRFFRRALQLSQGSPSRIAFLLQTLLRQRRAAQLRRQADSDGCRIPPFLICSVTQRCNLICQGCYAHKLHNRKEQELTLDQWEHVLAQARELGVSFVLLAGGEPLIRPGILDITRRFPEMIFPLFTNGTLLNETILDKLEPQRHVIPVLSMEGGEMETDCRRGAGVYQGGLAVLDKLKARHMFFGLSLTVTRENYALVTSEKYLRSFIRCGSGLFFFVEYIPVQEATEELVITPQQRQNLEQRVQELKKLPGLFVSFPGDEQIFGGCLSAGKGFAHIGSDGSVEPCPFAPYSDTNVRTDSLKQALQSALLRTIREHSFEEQGGCTLWNQRDRVSLLINQKANIA